VNKKEERNNSQSFGNGLHGESGRERRSETVKGG